MPRPTRKESVWFHLNDFVYEAITLYGLPFQVIQLSNKLYRLGLFPVRSPLLRKSQLISFPPVTEMFHFTGFASGQQKTENRKQIKFICFPFSVFCYPDDTHHCVPGCPIRKSTDQSFLATPRGLSQPSASFIASVSQGIHRMPLVTYLCILRLII